MITGFDILKPKLEEDILKKILILTQDEKDAMLFNAALDDELNIYKVKLLIKYGAKINVLIESSNDNIYKIKQLMAENYKN